MGRTESRPVAEKDGGEGGAAPRGRWAEGLAVLGLAACIAAFLCEAWPVSPHLDDAYISYRYARNLVEGAGLVYNPGEYVEGFTNLLWTLLVAAGLALGLEAKTAAHALGVASGVAALVATFGYARTGLAKQHAWLAALAPALVLCSIAFPRWSTSGMETPLFVAAVIAALWAQAAGRMGWATAGVCVATLTRPDGALLAAAVFGFLLPRLRREGPRALAGPAVWLGLLALLSAFRLSYYGSIVPNTFYAKVPGVPLALGARYLADFLADGSAFLLLPAAVAALREPALRPGALFAAVFSAYVVGVGGDVFAHGRFLLPVLAVLAVLAVRGTLHLCEQRLGLGLAAGACLALAAWVQVYGGTFSVDGLRESKRATAIQAARRLDRAFESGGHRKAAVIRARGEPVRLIAVTGIGSFGYYSRLPILDLLGLVDATIARGPSASPGGGYPVPGHVRSNADYILARQPDYILMPKKGAPALLNAHLDLWAHPDFERLYAWDAELKGYRRRAGGDR